jgi:hypothetical protein
MKQIRVRVPLAVWGSLLAAASITVVPAQIVVLSDNFSRPGGMPVGTPPSRDTTSSNQTWAAANWVSSWGANNNPAGGYVTQTYTPYSSGGTTPASYRVDGANGISGNWLNNGDATYPLKLAGSATTTTESIGIPGFAWVQINHDFAADPVVAAAGFLRVSFDLYRTPGGNISWFFGQDDATGVNNGTAGSPATIAANDISLYWRGTQAATYGLRDNGAVPSAVPGIANYDTIAYNGSPDLSTLPIPIQIDIAGTSFGLGAPSTIQLWVAGIQQDLNGDAVGTGYTFIWDGGGAAYMGFASNNNPTEGTVAAPVYRASGIDNLVISVPEPGVVSFLVLGAAALFMRRRLGR